MHSQSVTAVANALILVEPDGEQHSACLLSLGTKIFRVCTVSFGLGEQAATDFLVLLLSDHRQASEDE